MRRGWMGPETTIRTGEKLTSLVVEGGHRLAGRVDVEGNKNSALPLQGWMKIPHKT